MPGSLQPLEYTKPAPIEVVVGQYFRVYFQSEFDILMLINHIIQ